jgi:rhodanese-related sulfurtransferase
MPRKTIDELVADARARLHRLQPRQAWDAAQDGGVLIDIRAEHERRTHGIVPGSLHHPLSALLWRLDPDCDTSNPKLPLDSHLILICREGYSSSWAAAALQDLGFERATDVVGGVDAWRAAGLPLEPLNGAGRFGSATAKPATRRGGGDRP